MRVALRSALFALVFYAGTVIAVLSAFLLVPFGPHVLRRQALLWAGFHRWCARFILGIRTRVEGDVPAGPHLFAAKHQSMFETLELLLIINDPEQQSAAKVGATVTVTGRVEQGMMTTCMQGTPFIVTTLRAK